MTKEQFQEALLASLVSIREEQLKQSKAIEQLMTVSIDTNAEVTTIRSRLIEQASRHGQEIHQHEKAIFDHEARLTKVERALPEAFDERVFPDAE